MLFEYLFTIPESNSSDTLVDFAGQIASNGLTYGG
jgi:hypothetical protein